MLLAVDRRRVSPPAQKLYSQKDSQEWFVKVTDEMYRGAIAEEGLSGAEGEAALQQVYTLRRRC